MPGSCSHPRQTPEYSTAGFLRFPTAGNNRCMLVRSQALKTDGLASGALPGWGGGFTAAGMESVVVPLLALRTCRCIIAEKVGAAPS